MNDQLTADQRRSGSFMSFIITVHPDQADTKYKYSSITCMACVQISLDTNGIDDSIYIHMLNNPHYILIFLEALENGINLHMDTLKK